MQHKCNINATYVHIWRSHPAAASRRRDGIYIKCTYVAFMLHFRAECICVAFPNYLHFAFLLYLNHLGKTGQANRLDTLTQSYFSTSCDTTLYDASNHYIYNIAGNDFCTRQSPYTPPLPYTPRIDGPLDRPKSSLVYIKWVPIKANGCKTCGNRVRVLQAGVSLVEAF